MVAFKTVFAVLATATAMVAGAPVEERELAKRYSGQATYFCKLQLFSRLSDNKLEYLHDCLPSSFLSCIIFDRVCRPKRQSRCLRQLQPGFIICCRCEQQNVRWRKVRKHSQGHQPEQRQDHHSESGRHVPRMRRFFVSELCSFIPSRLDVTCLAIGSFSDLVIRLSSRLDLSVGAFKALGNMDAGVLPITWYYE